MPVHHVARDDVDAALDEIQKTERVIHVLSEGEGAYSIWTEPRAKRSAPGEKETRPA